MIMEAFHGHSHNIEYGILGHSGDTADLELVMPNKPPKNEKDRLTVLRKMRAHADMCDSGDNSLESCELAIKRIADQPADERFVFLLSDANLEQYGIGASQLQRLLSMDKRVRVFIVFIGSIGLQASRISQGLPAGQVLTALDWVSFKALCSTQFSDFGAELWI